MNHGNRTKCYRLATIAIGILVSGCAAMHGAVYERDSLSASLYQGERAHLTVRPSGGTYSHGNLDCRQNGGVEAIFGFEEYIDAEPNSSIDERRIKLDDMVFECVEGAVQVTADSVTSIFRVLTATPKGVGAGNRWPYDVLIFNSHTTYKYKTLEIGPTAWDVKVGVSGSRVKVFTDGLIPQGAEVYAGQDGEFKELFHHRVKGELAYEPSRDLHIVVYRGRSSELGGWSHVQLNREQGRFLWRHREERPEFVE